MKVPELFAVAELDGSWFAAEPWPLLTSHICLAQERPVSSPY